MKCLIFVVLVIAVLVENSDAKPAKYQDLPKKNGYVPVYIRVGNTPLEQINRELAAAFQASNARSIRGTMIQQLNRNARFSSESSSVSSSEEITSGTQLPAILKRLDPNYQSSESNSDESNSSEQVFNLAPIAPAVKHAPASSNLV